MRKKNLNYINNIEESMEGLKKEGKKKEQIEAWTEEREGERKGRRKDI